MRVVRCNRFGVPGTGTVELSKAFGARVIAAASRHEKLAACLEHAARETIDYERENLREALKKLTDGGGVDVVYDPVGGSSVNRPCAASHGADACWW